MQRSIPPRYDTRLESGAMKRACVATDNKTPDAQKHMQNSQAHDHTQKAGRVN